MLHILLDRSSRSQISNENYINRILVFCVYFSLDLNQIYIGWINTSNFALFLQVNYVGIEQLNMNMKQNYQQQPNYGRIDGN